MAEIPLGPRLPLHSRCAQSCSPSLFLWSPHTPSVVVGTYWARRDTSCVERFQDAGLGHTYDFGNFDGTQPRFIQFHDLRFLCLQNPTPCCWWLQPIGRRSEFNRGVAPGAHQDYCGTPVVSAKDPHLWGSFAYLGTTCRSAGRVSRPFSTTSDIDGSAMASTTPSCSALDCRGQQEQLLGRRSLEP